MSEDVREPFAPELVEAEGYLITSYESGKPIQVPLSGTGVTQRTPAPPRASSITDMRDLKRMSIDPIPDFEVGRLTVPRRVNVHVNDPSVTHILWQLFAPDAHMMPSSFSTTAKDVDAITRPFILNPSNFSGTGFVGGKYLLRCIGFNSKSQPIVYVDRIFNVVRSPRSMSAVRIFNLLPTPPVRPLDDKTAKAIREKRREYYARIRFLRNFKDSSRESFGIPKLGISYLIYANDATQKVLNIIADELVRWVDAHMYDAEFLTHDAEWGTSEMLATRRDLLFALRLAQLQPVEREKFYEGIHRPLYVTIIETAISFIPIIGNAVALYESYTGEDLYGYELDTVDRAVLAGSVLLPFVGRFIKGGRALYSAERMVQLYGRDAAEWSRAIAAGEGLAAHPNGVKLLTEADNLVHSGKHIADNQTLEKEIQSLFEDINNAEKSITSGATTAAKDIAHTSIISQKLESLAAKYPILKTLPLDALAIDRILAKGSNISQVKGQLLEELLGSKITELLGTNTGKALLGIGNLEGQLEFIPGHLIRDTAGRQWSDGVLAIRQGNTLHILTIFEAKAGKRSARELSLASSSISDLSKEEREELRAEAREDLRKLRQRARRTGKPVTKTLEDIEKEFHLTELGGQVRRDIERAAPSEGQTSTKFLVDNVETNVIVSPRGTRVVGVLPTDVKSKSMIKDLRGLDYTFDVLNIDIKQNELETLAKELSDIMSAAK